MKMSYMLMNKKFNVVQFDDFIELHNGDGECVATFINETIFTIVTGMTVQQYRDQKVSFKMVKRKH